MRQAQIDGGERQGVTSSESELMRRLERENRELREAHAVLRDAAVFFAGKLDPDAADPRFIESHRSGGRLRGSICQVLREQGLPVAGRTCCRRRLKTRPWRPGGFQ